jgi:hypothetical protein
VPAQLPGGGTAVEFLVAAANAHPGVDATPPSAISALSTSKGATLEQSRHSPEVSIELRQAPPN